MVITVGALEWRCPCGTQRLLQFYRLEQRAPWDTVPFTRKEVGICFYGSDFSEWGTFKDVPFFIIYLFIYLFRFLGLHLWHMDFPRLGVELELQLLDCAVATATATWDLSHIYYLHHSLRQHRILNPLSKARGQTCTLMDTSQVCNLLRHKGKSQVISIFWDSFNHLWPKGCGVF